MPPLSPNLLHFPNYYANNHLFAANFTNQNSQSTVDLKPLIPINFLLNLSLSQQQATSKRNKRSDADDPDGGYETLKWNLSRNSQEKKEPDAKRATSTDNVCKSPGKYVALISPENRVTFHKKGDTRFMTHLNCGKFDVRDLLHKFFLEYPAEKFYRLEVFKQGINGVATTIDIKKEDVQNVDHFTNYLRDQLNRELNYNGNELLFHQILKGKPVRSFICKKEGNINEQSCKEAAEPNKLQCDLSTTELVAEINEQCPDIITTTTTSTTRPTSTTQKPTTTTEKPTTTTSTTTTQKPITTTKGTTSTIPTTVPTTSTTTTTQKPATTKTSITTITPTTPRPTTTKSPSPFFATYPITTISTTSSTTTTSTPITTKAPTTIKPTTHRPLPPLPPRLPDNPLARCLNAPTEPGNYVVARLFLGNANGYCSIWANQTEARWQLSNGNGNVEAIRAMINGGTLITSNNDTCLRQQFKLDYICRINPQTGRADPNTAVFTDNNYAFCRSYPSDNNLLELAVRNQLTNKLNHWCPLPALATEGPKTQTPVLIPPAAQPEDNFSPQINYGGYTYKGEGASRNLKKGLQKACAHYHITTANNPTPKAGKVKCNEESKSLYLTALACDEFEKEISGEEVIELFQDDCRTGPRGLTSISAQQGPLQEYTFANSRTSGRTQFSLFSYNPQLTKAHREELLDNRAIKIKCSTGLQSLTDIQIERATSFTELCLTPTVITTPVPITPPREETPIIEYDDDRNEALLRSYAGYTEDGQAPKLTTVSCNSKEFYILREPLEHSNLPIQTIAEEIKLDCNAVKYNAYNAITYLTSNATAAAANPEVYNQVQLQNGGSAIYLNIANGAELNEAHRIYLENNGLLHYKCTGKLGWESFPSAQQGLRVNLDEKIKAVENMCSSESTTTIATTIATTPFISRNLTAECHVPYRPYNPEEDAENSNLISTNPENLVSRRRGFSTRGDWEFDIRAKMSKAPPSHYDRFWAKVSAPDHEGACSIRGWIDENEPFKVSNGRGIEMIKKFCENDEPFTVAIGTLNNVEREILEHERTTTMLPLKDAKAALCPSPSELETLGPQLAGRQLEEETQGIIMKKLVKKIVEVNPELQHSSTQTPTTTQQPTIPIITIQKPPITLVSTSTSTSTTPSSTITEAPKTTILSTKTAAPQPKATTPTKQHTAKPLKKPKPLAPNLPTTSTTSTSSTSTTTVASTSTSITLVSTSKTLTPVTIAALNITIPSGNTTIALGKVTDSTPATTTKSRKTAPHTEEAQPRPSDNWLLAWAWLVISILTIGALAGVGSAVYYCRQRKPLKAKDESSYKDRHTTDIEKNRLIEPTDENNAAERSPSLSLSSSSVQEQREPDNIEMTDRKPLLR